MTTRTAIPLLVVALGGAMTVVPTTADAKVLRVPGEYASIRSAIEVAGIGDTVLVAPGEYFGEGDERIELHGVSVIAEAGPWQTAWGIWGGVTIWESTAPVTIEGLLLGYDTFHGGGIAVFAPESTVVRNCVFADYGGYGDGPPAIACWGDATVVGNLFSHGGVYSIKVKADGSAAIDGNVFAACGASTAKSIDVSSRAGQVDITHNTFGRAGGRIGVAALVQPVTASLNVRSNLFHDPWFDSAGIGCAGPYAEQVAIHASYNRFHDEGFYGGCEPDLGPGNVFDAADPLFCDPETCDYTVHSDSPAIGAGEGGSIAGALGIGCGVVGVPTETPGRPTTARVTPSPSTGAITVGVPAPYTDAPLFLNVHDATGRIVHRTAGRGRAIAWSGRLRGEAAPAGVYFVELRTVFGDLVARGRVTLVR